MPVKKEKKSTTTSKAKKTKTTKKAPKKKTTTKKKTTAKKTTTKRKPSTAKKTVASKKAKKTEPSSFAKATEDTSSDSVSVATSAKGGATADKKVEESDSILITEQDNSLLEELDIEKTEITEKLPTEELQKTKKSVKKPENEFNEIDILKGFETEDEQKSKPVSIKLYRRIAYLFIFLTVALVFLVAYFYFSKLTITLISNKERISDNIIFDVSNTDKEDESSQYTFVGAVEELEISQEGSYEVSGTEILGEEIMGTVIITNNYSKNQPLVANTRLLSSSNKLFRTRETVNVPAGGSVEVEIYAEEPSQDMAIAPTTFTIPGLWAGLQDKIYGESEEKFVYQQQIKKYVQESDIDMAIKDLKNELIVKVRENFGESYKGYDQVIYELDENNMNTSVDAKVGDEKENINIRIEAQVVIIAFSGGQVGISAEETLTTLVPDNKELVEFNEEDIVYNLDNYNVDEGRATINASFEGRMVLNEDADVIDVNKLVDLDKEQIEDYLDDFQEIAGYEISFFPAFVTKAPSLTDRIKIKIEN